MSGGNSNKTASESTKQLMRIAQLGDKNHNYGKSKTEETKNKIRETNLNKIERKSHNGEILPKYVKYGLCETQPPAFGCIKWSDREGYAIVSHPKLNSSNIKYFVDSKLTNNEKFEKCLEYLNSLN